MGNHTPPNPLYLRGGVLDTAGCVPTGRVRQGGCSRLAIARSPTSDPRPPIFDPRLLFLLEIVVIHLDAEDDDAAHCGDEVGPEDCEALAKDAKHNTLQHKGDAANANH